MTDLEKRIEDIVGDAVAKVMHLERYLVADNIYGIVREAREKIMEAIKEEG